MRVKEGDTFDYEGLYEEYKVIYVKEGPQKALEHASNSIPDPQVPEDFLHRIHGFIDGYEKIIKQEVAVNES